MTRECIAKRAHYLRYNPYEKHSFQGEFRYMHVMWWWSDVNYMKKSSCTPLSPVASKPLLKKQMRQPILNASSFGRAYFRKIATQFVIHKPLVALYHWLESLIAIHGGTVRCQYGAIVQIEETHVDVGGFERRESLVRIGEFFGWWYIWFPWKWSEQVLSTDAVTAGPAGSIQHGWAKRTSSNIHHHGIEEEESEISPIEYCN